MTTKEFIKKTAGVPSTKDRHCSSVFTDNDGVVFSYGYHYPLLFTVDGVTFVNNVGYSNSTSKHISWAKSAMNYNAIDLWVSGCNQYTWRNGENAAKIPNLLSLARYGMDQKLVKALKKAVLADLEAERADIQERIDSKKRTDTAIYRGLIGEYNDCVARLNLVQRAWGLK